MEVSASTLISLVLLSLISASFTKDETFMMIEKDPVWALLGSDATVTCQWEHSTPNASVQVVVWKASGAGIRKITRDNEDATFVFDLSPIDEGRQSEDTDWGEPASEDNPMVVQTSRLTIYGVGVDDPEVYTCTVEIGQSQKEKGYTMKVYSVPTVSMKDVVVEVDVRPPVEVEMTTAAPSTNETDDGSEPIPDSYDTDDTGNYDYGGDNGDYDGDDNTAMRRRKRQDDASEEQMITVECVIEGAYPEPSRVEFIIAESESMDATDVDWTQDAGTQLYNGVATLNLSPDTKYDGKSVECKAWLPTEPPQEFKSDNTSSIIQILHETTYVETILDPSTVNEGDPASIQCVADGNPRPTFTVTTDVSDRPEIDQSDDRRFNIASVRKSDAGLYWCVATLQGRTETSETLESENKPELIVNYLMDPSLSQNGVITKVKGEQLTVDCSSDSYPMASTMWKKDGVTKDNSDRLFLSDLQYDDAGVYVCETTNEVGTTKKSFELKVEGRCEATMKEPSISFSSGTGKEGTLRLKLECEVDGKPDCDVDIQAQPGFDATGTKSNGGKVIVYDGLSKFNAPVSFYCIARNARTTPYANVSMTIDTAYEDICCDEPKKGGLGTGAIIGIILLVLVILAGIPLACYFVKKRQAQPKKKSPGDTEAAEPEKEGLREKEASSEDSDTGSLPPPPADMDNDQRLDSAHEMTTFSTNK